MDDWEMSEDERLDEETLRAACAANLPDWPTQSARTIASWCDDDEAWELGNVLECEGEDGSTDDGDASDGDAPSDDDVSSASSASSASTSGEPSDSTGVSASCLDITGTPVATHPAGLIAYEDCDEGYVIEHVGDTVVDSDELSAILDASTLTFEAGILSFGLGLCCDGVTPCIVGFTTCTDEISEAHCGCVDGQCHWFVQA